MVELSYSDAGRRAERRRAPRGRRIGVAVRRTWRDGPGDGIGAEIVATDGARVARLGSVVVFRAAQWVNIDALETALESHALGYLPGNPLRELEYDVAEKSPVLHARLAELFFAKQAA